MNGLLDLQSKFQAYLLQQNSDIASKITSNFGPTVTRRLEIYKDGYQARLFEALENDYPALVQLLGQAQFRLQALPYIETQPSSFRSLRWYGQAFAGFLKATAPAHLAELAAFEWRLGLAFDAEDGDNFALEQMATIPPTVWPNLRIEVQASLQRINTNSNAITLWQQLMNEERVDAPVDNASPNAWLIWRCDYVPKFCLLSIEEAWAIDSLLQGATFGDLCEGLCTFVPAEEAGLCAAGLLKKWILSAFIKDIRY